MKLAIMAAMAATMLTVAACATTPAATPTPQPTPTATPVATPTPWDREPKPQVAIGAPFSLKIGESAEVDGGRLLVHLSAVINDSRCPTDVVCIHAGSVTATLQLASQQGGTTSHDLEFKLSPASAVHGEYRVVVTGVEPYPTAAGGAMAAADYSVSLVVENAG